MVISYVIFTRKDDEFQVNYLVLGANGYIGSYLYTRMITDKLKVIGTGHCRKGAETLVDFDILNDSVCNITKLLSDKKTAIICIAQTNIDKCKENYDLSRQINVIFTAKIIETLIQENFHVIYFSTDNVFDGGKGNYTEYDKTNAINQYGKMKAEMEFFLSEKYPEVCIFRLPKVLGIEKEKQNLLTDLENKLSEREIRCIKGTKMSIVAKEDIYRACLIAAEKKLHGLYNLSSGEIYSRKELTERFFDCMKIHDKKIVELELEEFGFKDMRPLNVSLDNSKFRREIGYEFESYDTIVEKYIEMSKIYT